MKIRLFSQGKELCTLKALDVPEGMNPQFAAEQIVERWRKGDWLWVDGGKRAIRHDSITSMEIVDESRVQDLTEEAS